MTKSNSKLPIYDEKVNILIRRDLCNRASDIAKMLDISVSRLFNDLIETALMEYEVEGEVTDKVGLDIEADEYNAIIKELSPTTGGLNQSAL